MKLEFCGAKITSDAGLFLDSEIDEALGLTAIAQETLDDPRTGSYLENPGSGR